MKKSPPPQTNKRIKLTVCPSSNIHYYKLAAPPKVCPREDTEHEALVQILSQAKPAIHFFHCPNGAKLSNKQAFKMKRHGMKSGIPDLIILGQEGNAAARPINIELKRQNGTKSNVATNQKKWLKLFDSYLNAVPVVAFGCKAAKKALEDAGYQL